MKIIVIGLICLLSLFLLGCPETPNYSRVSVQMYMGIPEADSLFPSGIILRRVDGNDSVFSTDRSCNISDTVSNDWWYATCLYDFDNLSSDGDYSIVFSIDTFHFEIPTETTEGYLRWIDIKVGGTDSLYYMSPGTGFSLPMDGVDSLYVWQMNNFLGSY